MSDAPFFIIGSERSGSNLLRLLLTTHSRLAVPHPPHLVHYFAPLQARYGDLAAAAPFHRLVADARRLLDRHIHPWDVVVDWARVEQEARPRDIFGIHDAVYAQYAAAKGKARWGCKSTFMVHHVPTLHANHPEARFLWLYRDPRDVAASSRASVFSPSHPVFAAELWRDQQALARDAERRWPDCVYRVSYEELVRAPERVMEGVCAALGEAFEPPMLAYFATGEAKRTAALSESWSNVGSAPTADRVGRAASVLSAAEITLVEAICAEGMSLLGYPTARSPAGRTFSSGERARFRYEQAWMDVGIEWRSLRKDKNAARRWQRALWLCWLRATR